MNISPQNIDMYKYIIIYMFKKEYTLDPRCISKKLYFTLIRAEPTEHFFNGGFGGDLIDCVETYCKKNKISVHGYEPLYCEICKYMNKIHYKHFIDYYLFEEDLETL